MFNPVAQPWFWPAVGVVVGLPLLLVLLTEVGNLLVRRASPAAKLVRLLRNYVVPAGALLLLLTQARYLNVDVTWTRVVATVFGFLVILAILSGLNIALFSTAESGSWRDRLPSIFVDLGRLVVIVVCLALLFTWVWDADVGGLFTALGVSSIVIGLALQNAAGSVVSGLLLLFEQPFRLGDWLDAGDVRGRVIEVNWRAVHIDTGNGIRIVPTASLAGSSFTNLSRAGGMFTVSSTVTFATDDAPFEVLALLRRVAGDLPDVVDGSLPTAILLGGAKYSVTMAVRSPADEENTTALFLVWLWYAARRHGLHLDGDLTDDYKTPERLEGFLRGVASSLRLTSDDAVALADVAQIERYGAGEVIQRAGFVPDGLRILVSGTAALNVPLADGAEVRVSQLREPDMLGLTSITRERIFTNAVALDDVTVLYLPVLTLDDLVRSQPALARDIGRSLDNRNQQVKDTLAAVGAAPAPVA